jgi:hypothetical protein
MKFLKLALLAGACALVSWAQQTAISGSVADQTGAVIANAAVRLIPVNGGAVLTAVTSTTGAYSFPSLQAMSYKVRVEVPGFTPAERTVNLLVGQSATADFALKPSASATTIEVKEEVVEIDVNSSQVGGNVDPGRMKNTPLNGRNWMELSLLVPGVTVNAVSTVPLGNGSQGRFQINVDGQQVTQNAAGAGFGQPQFSREAMAQFQVITNRFDATLGRSAQLQINAQTKSGTNSLHGSGYGYFRSDKFNAADPIGQRVLPFKNQQFGGTVGGAIIKDKLFFFGAYEGERQPSTVVLTPTGFTGQRFEFQNDFQTNTYLTRVDWQQSASRRLSFRFNKSEWRNPFGNVTGTSHPSQAARQTRDNWSIFLNYNWTMSPTLVSEIKYGFNKFMWQNTPYVESLEIRIPGAATIGGPYNFPQIFDQKTNQIRNDLYWMKGAHSVKFGGEYLSNNHTGLFQQNLRGTASPLSAAPANLPSLVPTWNDPKTWNIAAFSPLTNSYVQGFGNFDIDIPRNVLGFWVQDDWKVSKKLTVNLGLRYDNDMGIWSTPTLKSNVVLPRGGRNANFAPRLGFAYDLTGSRKTVIRGGTGLYFADIQANQVINQSIFNGEKSIQASVNKTATTNIDLTNPFGGLTGADFISGRVASPIQNLQVLDKDAKTPFSFQASFGGEHQFRGNWTVSADFVYWRVYNEWLRQDRNLFFNSVTGFQANPATAGRPDTRFGQILNFTTPSASGAIYYGGQFELTRRFGNRFQVGTSYTLSKLKDSTDGAFSYANNQFDLADEWARSLDDQRHTLNFDGSVNLPWGLSSSLFYHFGSGNPFRSLSPTNPFAYAGANNRTFLSTATTFINPSFITTSRATGYSNVKRNSLSGLAINRLDWRLNKSFTIKERLTATGIFEVFNVLNAQNYGTYNTNIGIASYGRPAYNSNLAYAARMLQFAARFDF